MVDGLFLRDTAYFFLLLIEVVLVKENKDGNVLQAALKA